MKDDAMKTFLDSLESKDPTPAYVAEWDEAVKKQRTDDAASFEEEVEMLTESYRDGIREELREKYHNARPAEWNEDSRTKAYKDLSDQL